MSKQREIVYIDGSRGNDGDFPVAVVYDQNVEVHGTQVGGLVVDPILDSNVTRNLYGRIMTLVEATTDPVRLKAVKDIFSKELMSWQSDVHDSARETAMGGGSSNNIYTKQ